MTEIARMYGGSLYDLAAEEGLETRILEELDAVADILKQDPEYLHLLSIPSIPKKERCALLDEAFRGKVHLYVLNFVKILCEKGTLRELPGCARAFRVKYNQAHGILEATAVTAVPMSADQTARLHEKLEAVTGKTIDLKTRVDAAVLGGIGSIPGAFVGGVLLGIIEIFAKAYISTQLSDAIVFGVLIVVLLVKPDGLLGKRTSEKV